MLWNPKKRHFSDKLVDMKQFNDVEENTHGKVAYGYIIVIDGNDEQNTPDKKKIYLFDAPEECVNRYEQQRRNWGY